MRKLILEEWISLDGHVAGANGQLDFFTSITPEQNTYSDRDQLNFLEGIDTILLGRKTYELFVNFWPTATTDKEVIADRLNEIPKMVFSGTLQEALWGEWPAATLVHSYGGSFFELPQFFCVANSNPGIINSDLKKETR